MQEMSATATIRQALVHPPADRRGRAGAEDPPPEILTPFEREIVLGLCEGLARDAIADRLGYSRSTVNKAISEIYAGTGFVRAYQLVAWAVRCGMWRGGGAAG
jgi:DNA-binding CsgD family transcriptional regulator